MSNLKSNAKRVHKNASTWVVTVLMGVVAYWLGLPPEQQQALMAAYPWLQHFAPLAGLGAFLAARVWPQQGQPPAEDARDTKPTDDKP